MFATTSRVEILPLGQLPPQAEDLRQDVRTFLAKEMQGKSFTDRVPTWIQHDKEFARKIGQQGWLGMTWPTEWYGQGRSMLERFVFSEEMLAAGAPVGQFWVADRQSAPLLIRFGTDAQRHQLLPQIAKGELCFGIGMSEPNSGSDLASVRTRAQPTGDGGYVLNGRKIWTSGGHHADYMIVLARTSGDADQRHAGLSQVLVPLNLPGVEVSTIETISGEAHFNEIVFEDVELPPGSLVGPEGNGWNQVMSELVFERSGAERYLSAFVVLEATANWIAHSDLGANRHIGQLVARIATLRHMSIAVLTKFENGGDPGWQAALVKELGAQVEQITAEVIQEIAAIPPLHTVGSPLEDEIRAQPESMRDLASALGWLTLNGPSFSLRGGTREILRGIVARGIGLR